jgi:hypothetical protein
MAKVNLDTAARLDITCRRGDTFELVLDFGADQTWVADDFKMEIAPNAGATATDTFENNGTTYFAVADNDDGDTKAKVTITIPASEMEALSAGLYVYDLQTTVSSVVKTHVYGTFQINEDVTTP